MKPLIATMGLTLVSGILEDITLSAMLIFGVVGCVRKMGKAFFRHWSFLIAVWGIILLQTKIYSQVFLPPERGQKVLWVLLFTTCFFLTISLWLGMRQEMKSHSRESA